MSTRQLKIAGIMLWGGAGMLILGILIGYPRFAPYLEAVFSTPDLAATPMITVTVPPHTPVVTPSALRPGEEGGIADQTGKRENDSLSPIATPTERLTATSPPLPTATPTVWIVGTKPERLRIPAIKLDAPIVAIGWTPVEVNGMQQAIWDVPEWYAVGWHRTSAKLGVPGNTVLNGHNTSRGEVFRNLYTLEPGSLVIVEGQNGQTYTYKIAETHILPEAGQPLEVRIQNAAYIQPTTDERLTLVTCYPYASLDNRLVVVAYPAEANLKEGE